jgi:hypothetical protein
VIFIYALRHILDVWYMLVEVYFLRYILATWLSEV